MAYHKKEKEHSTSGGRLYKTTEDFFSQKKIQETIKKLMESDIYKDLVKAQAASS